jgi:signal transduction histidine kinase
MDELTEELLAYSRLTAEGDGENQLDLVPLSPLVDRVVDRVQLLIDDRAAQIDVDPLPFVWGNELLLRQVVRNLLVNALRYNDADAPRVRIWSETETSRHVVRFADNGRGVAPEDRERIFDAYFRRAREPNGTGLGLALCREAMERQGGEIWLEASGPDGSVFVLALPRPPAADTQAPNDLA